MKIEVENRPQRFLFPISPGHQLRALFWTFRENESLSGFFKRSKDPSLRLLPLSPQISPPLFRSYQVFLSPPFFAATWIKIV